MTEARPRLLATIVAPSRARPRPAPTRRARRDPGAGRETRANGLHAEFTPQGPPSARRAAIGGGSTPRPWASVATASSTRRAAPGRKRAAAASSTPAPSCSSGTARSRGVWSKASPSPRHRRAGSGGRAAWSSWCAGATCPRADAPPGSEMAPDTWCSATPTSTSSRRAASSRASGGARGALAIRFDDTGVRYLVEVDPLMWVGPASRGRACARRRRSTKARLAARGSSA